MGLLLVPLAMQALDTEHSKSSPETNVSDQATRGAASRVKRVNPGSL